MAKGRTPDTVEDALGQASGLVGIERVAGWIGKSADMVRKFCDPDKDHHLPLRAALEIDRQLALAGYPQVMAELVAFRAGRHATAAQQLTAGLAEDAPAERPLKLAATMACAAAELVARIDLAEADGHYSAAEIADLCKAATALGRSAADIKRTVAAQRGRRRP